MRKKQKRLSRKYPSLPSDLVQFVNDISINPVQGRSLGDHCFKMRFAIKSKNAGKNGGARVITCVKIVMKTVILISIYDKSEKASITDAELKARLKRYL